MDIETWRLIGEGAGYLALAILAIFMFFPSKTEYTSVFAKWGIRLGGVLLVLMFVGAFALDIRLIKAGLF